MIEQYELQNSINISGNSSIAIPSNVDLLPEGDWTISIEVKGVDNAGGERTWANLFQQTLGGTAYVLDAYRTTAGDGSESWWFGSGENNETGRFQHETFYGSGHSDWITITVVKTGTQLDYYVEGWLRGSITPGTMPTRVDLINGPSGQEFAEGIQNLRIFDSAASPEQVMSLYLGHGPDGVDTTWGDSPFVGATEYEPNQVIFDVTPTPNGADGILFGWSWNPDGEWNFHDGSVDMHNYAYLEFQHWDTDLNEWSPMNTTKYPRTSGFAHTPAPYVLNTPYGISFNTAWAGGAIDPLIRVSFYGMLSNAEGNNSSTKEDPALSFIWNTVLGVVVPESEAFPSFTLNGEQYIDVIENDEYVDLGVSVIDIDGDALSVTTTGDPVNTSLSVGTVFQIDYEVTSIVTGMTVTVNDYRTVTIVADTSEDGDSDNGENSTQPMEEIIMSFDFSIDLAGGAGTLVEDENHNETTMDGTATASFENCKVKKFLSAVEAKGLKLCGDLVIEGGEIYFADGTAGHSLVKELDMCFGVLQTVDGVVTGFTHMDPADKGIEDSDEDDDGDLATDGGLSGDDSQYGSSGIEGADGSSPVAGAAAAAKWFLKIQRPGHTVEYKEMQAVNDLMTAASVSGRIMSIMGVMETVETLQDAVSVALDNELLARKADVDALETKMDADIVSLAAFLTQMESDLIQYIQDEDAAVVTFIEARLDELVGSIDDLRDADSIHATLAVSQEAADEACGEVSVKIDLEGQLSASIEEFMWDVGLTIGDSRRNDLDIVWEIKPDMDNAGARSLFATFASCDPLDGAGDGMALVVNAQHCGAPTVAVGSNADGLTYESGTAPSSSLPLNDGEDADSDLGGTKIQ